MDLQLSRSDIDQFIRKFNLNPSSDDYHIINNWYSYNSNNSYVDKEYLICVYLFLVGANIKHRYYPISRDQQLDYIKEIRESIEGAEPLLRAQRKVYLDLGTKAGFYH